MTRIAPNAPPLLLSEDDLRKAVAETDPITPIEQAFAAFEEGNAVLPGIISLEVSEKRGEYHIKGAYLAGSPLVVFKSANSYYGNPAKGLPSSSGFFAAFDAGTGVLRAIMFDNGFLTHVRTGVAGAIAAKYLANKRLRQVTVLGCGTQARFQLQYLRCVREVRRLRLWDCCPAHAERFKSGIGGGIEVSVEEDVRRAVERSDCIVTVTPSTEPLVMADWVTPGTHITAVGADNPDKQELDKAIFARADVIVADSLSQCLERGEIHHAVEDNVIRAEDVDAELGAVILGKSAGRTGEEQITVCDLTGVGVQDAAVASLVLDKALELGLGRVAKT